jgi:hypothetical protein
MPAFLRHAALAVLAALLCRTATAQTALTPSLSEVVAQSSIVVQAKIMRATAIETEGKDCGLRYSARVVEALKADRRIAAGTIIEFGREPSLTVGNTYIVFLRDKDLVVTACESLLPRYEVDTRLDLQVINSQIIQRGPLPAAWPAAIPLTSTSLAGDDDHLIDLEPLLAYLRDLR